MSWLFLVAVVVVLGLALLAVATRRHELQGMQRNLEDRDRAVRNGSAEAQLQHPVVDLSRCLGCGTCVAACPEDNVLEIVHGQAMVVNGARCNGVSACERECPVGAITVTLANVETREDIPALDDGLEAIGSPGLFLAGEVTAHALIKTAVDHGAAVGAEVARRVETTDPSPDDALDLVVVGAGPAGLACSLEAKRNGLSFVMLDQEDRAGGTVAKYPRRKIVMTQPVELPLYGRFDRTEYTKEELVDLWQRIVDEQELPIRGGEVFVGLDRDDDGRFSVRTETGSYSARHVCLALGRRGVPRRLGVPGEELSKVAYSLLDASSYTNRRIVVVGGGDNAVETALGLAEQPGNLVTLSYRKEAFFRLRARTEQRVEAAVAGNRLDVQFRSRLAAIHPDSVELVVEGTGGDEVVVLPNDDVFVMAGGVAPFELLGNSGVSFDPRLRDLPLPVAEQGSGLVRALAIGFVLSLLALAFALWHLDYYGLSPAERPTHGKHILLRPGRGIGLGLGMAASGLVVVNLLYLLRRAAWAKAPRLRRWFHRGSLKTWMTSHVATGILVFLCAALHGAMAPRETVGGHAFWALAVLLVTGAVGRYLYAYVPRAANGRELELAEVRAELQRIDGEWEVGERAFRQHVHTEIDALIARRQWRGTFFGRLLALVGVQLDLRRTLARLGQQARADGVAADQVREAVGLARRAHRTALMVAHYEDLRAVLASWRYVHRWAAALMVLLVAVHIVYALTYGSFG